MLAFFPYRGNFYITSKSQVKKKREYLIPSEGSLSRYHAGIPFTVGVVKVDFSFLTIQANLRNTNNDYIDQNVLKQQT